MADRVSMARLTKDRLNLIKAISFDGDMTLWDFEKVIRHSLRFTLRELRQRLPCPAADELTIDKMIEIRNKGKVTNFEEIRLHAFKRTVEHVDAKDHAIPWSRIFKGQNMPEHYRHRHRYRNRIRAESTYNKEREKDGPIAAPIGMKSYPGGAREERRASTEAAITITSTSAASLSTSAIKKGNPAVCPQAIRPA